MHRARTMGICAVLACAALAWTTGLAPRLHGQTSDTLLKQSAVFLWEATPPRPTDKGFVRSVFRAPTATLDELEYHITTLNPGQSPHPPHQHANEEVIVVKEGTVEAYVNGAWTPVTTGSLIFFASNQPHTVRNTGTAPATYHVINWASPGMLKKTAGKQ
ncbi:MAG TPA: cupin domain-containing protein [Vicinamibacterales bacterium]